MGVQGSRLMRVLATFTTHCAQMSQSALCCRKRKLTCAGALGLRLGCAQAAAGSPDGMSARPVPSDPEAAR